MQEEWDRLREEMNKNLSKKKPALDDLKILSLSVFQKMFKLGDTLLEKHVLERRSRMWLDNLLLMLKRLGVWFMHPLNHLNRSQEQWWDYSGKICGETSCLMVWNNVSYTGNSQDFWECYTSRNTTCLPWKGSRIGWNEARLSNLQNSASRKQVDKILSYKCDTFQEKQRVTQRVEHMAQRAEPQVTEDYSQALKPSKIFNTGF